MSNSDAGNSMSREEKVACDILWEHIYEGLKYNHFMTLEEYNQRCLDGSLNAYKFPTDDQMFYDANPDNPMALGNRFPRIEAGDDFRQFVVNGNRKMYITEEMIDFLNEHMFDCCASVRQSLIIGLSYIGNEKSFEYYEKLFIIEKSNSNREMLKNIIHLIP